MSNTAPNAQLALLESRGALIADSFRAAQALAKKNPDRDVFADAGEGWLSRSRYVPRFRRVVVRSIRPDGVEL